MVPGGAAQSRTGRLNVATTATLYWPPLAQLGTQSSMFSIPVPTASVPVHVLQVMP